MASDQHLSLDAIKQRVDAAEQDGWYGYDEEARADVRWLIEQLQSAQDEINERTSDQALTLRKYRELQEQLEAEQDKNAKLSALVIEQEGLYRDERKAWRKALDSAMQYVPLKDHDFIEAIVSNPAMRPQNDESRPEGRPS